MARALVVDDAKIMRINLTNMLKKLGHEVVADADSGYNGIEMYKEHKPDIVTMDITMPEVNGIGDGIEAVVEIKKEFPDAKIIMVTSHGEQEKVIRAVQAGAVNYILKPIDIQKLETVIKKVLK